MFGYFLRSQDFSTTKYNLIKIQNQIKILRKICIVFRGTLTQNHFAFFSVNLIKISYKTIRTRRQSDYFSYFKFFYLFFTQILFFFISFISFIFTAIFHKHNFLLLFWPMHGKKKRLYLYFIFHHRKNFNAHQYKCRKQTTTGERVRGKVLVCIFLNKKNKKSIYDFFLCFSFVFSVFGNETFYFIFNIFVSFFVGFNLTSL